jgi:hypothetical protein
MILERFVALLERQQSFDALTALAVSDGKQLRSEELAYSGGRLTQIPGGPLAMLNPFSSWTPANPSGLCTTLKFDGAGRSSH